MDTKQDPQNAPDEIEEIIQHPCGCRTAKLKSGDEATDMCVPCCLGNAADLLSRAGQRMAREYAAVQKQQKSDIVTPEKGLIVPDYIDGNKA